MSKVYFGVDISEHNGKVDWNKVAKKVDFAILRIGWVGNNSNKMDTRFLENYKAAKKAGVKLGAYVYMYSKSTSAAKAGAEWILKQIKGLTFEMPIYCDMEDETISGLGKSTLTNITIAFNDVIKAGGYKVGTYTSRYWYDTKLDKVLKTKYHTWIAHYTTGTNKYMGEYEMWQNSSKGKVDGVSGNVDTNYLYENLFTTIPAKPTTTPTQASTKVEPYKVGKTYTLKVDLNVRVGAGTNYRQKKTSELTADGRKHALNQTYAVLKKGTKVTCNDIIKKGNDIWFEIPSGYVAAVFNGKTYIG
ncbi:MAG: glycoside hydrolase family 25 protein [Eubacterium coprostanoligenes]|nr:glycoside hydrolase family 25 protein [Eubacterium coprostanoligenes]